MTLNPEKLLAQLDEHQVKALDIIKRGDVLLAPDALPNPPLCAQSRWELIRIMSAYQAFKRFELFDPIIRSGPSDKAQLAEKMKAECMAIGGDFRDHVTRCANIDIAAQWTAYRPAVAELLARIKAHMVRERWLVETKLLPRPSLAPSLQPVLSA